MLQKVKDEPIGTGAHLMFKEEVIKLGKAPQVLEAAYSALGNISLTNLLGDAVKDC